MTRMPKAFILLVLIMIIPAPGMAETGRINIRMPNYFDGQHEYFFDLIMSALEEAGYPAVMDDMKNLPHLRERSMLSAGEINVLWMLRTTTRDERYLPVPVNLTNGLIGKRILLTLPERSKIYRNVETLDDFRNLHKVGGFGKGWYDVEVWDENGLESIQVADWRLLFKLAADPSRGVDYLARGFNEVIQEAKDHPNLAIEPHLMLVYDRDFIFYVSPQEPELVPILTYALTKAQKSGLMDRLINKHYGKNFEILKPETRTVIKLASPQ